MTAVAAAASVPVNDITYCTFPNYNQEVLGFNQHSNQAEYNSGEMEMCTPQEGSSPTSPSEGSESLGSHSQTEVPSVIERGDTATPDTHSDVQDNSCSESHPEADEKSQPNAQERPAASD